MISITDQREAIQAVLQTIPDVKTVFLRRPKAIQPAQLPAVVFFPGRATYDRREDGALSLTIRREWTARIYAMEHMAGRPGDSEATAEPFLSAVPETLGAYLRLALDDGRVFDLELHSGGDGGVMALPYGDITYTGVEVRFFTKTETYLDPQSD